MPCQPGMRGCRLDCAHRRFVLDYVAERDAQTVRAEAFTGGNHTEEIEYHRDIEARLTFANYLANHRGRDYPYPRHDRKEAA